MENKYQVPRGTQDLYGDYVTLWQQMEEIIAHQCNLFGYKEIRTPIFEHAEVFKQDNDSSDMVNKEMYCFKDNGERDLALRPEGTKGVIRSFVEHKMYGNADMPVKLFYKGPMFRYDRPQKGRYRQFHQFGVEAIGVKNPLLDVEVIALGYAITKQMGINNVVVLINSLGDKESREAYRAALKDYFKPYLDQLCEDCRRRYDQNPLRILDCKADRANPIMADAPKCRDYLNDASKEYFETVIKGLDELGIPYQIDDRLVRGLDYYTNTVFEAVPIDDNGQQATVFGGGQYDGLVDLFGGGQLAGIGFGMGMERMIDLAMEQGSMQPRESLVDYYVISLGNVGNYAVKIANTLRSNGLSVDMDFQSRSLKAQFKTADRFNAKNIIIVGEDEVANQTMQLKNCETKEQKNIKFDELLKEAGVE